MRFSVSVVFLLALVPAAAQTRVNDRNANGWFMYFGDHPISQRWELHLEGQWRRHDVATKWQQLLIRPGVNYRLSKDVLLTAGYGFINTYQYGDFPVSSNFPEHRLYQQAIVTHRAGNVGFSHRYRLEQRWIGIPKPADSRALPQDWRFQHRFRYMARMNVPLSKPPADGPARWYLGLYDEVFIHFGFNAPVNLFDQNRAYAAVGRQVNKSTRVEFGYMHHAVVQRSGRVVERNHTLQLAVFSNLSFRRKP